MPEEKKPKVVVNSDFESKVLADKDLSKIDSYFVGMIEQGQDIGTAPTEGKTAAEILVTDRSTKITLNRDNEASEWAYENDPAVYSAVERLDTVMNNGFDVLMKVDEGKEPSERQKKAKELIEERVPLLINKASSVITNKCIHGWAVLKKTIKRGGKDIVGLVELNPKECVPIINSYTGELGGKAGKGLDSTHPNDEVALIQKGHVYKYQSDGQVNQEDKTFYFKRDEIIPFPNEDRGKFIGTSPIGRVLRLVEIKKSMENVVELIVRRFGPQICVIVGNADYNLSKADIPPEYLRDDAGNPVSRATARKNYKTAVFSNIETNIRKWADGDTLVQMMEYGVDVKTINPTASPFDYARYIDLFSNYIKIGILGVYVQGRIDITSAVMQERLMRDLKDKANRERVQIENILNKEYVDEVLKANGYSTGYVYIKFKQIDRVDDQRDANVEMLRSQAMRNYMSYVGKIPDYLLKKWDMEDLKDAIPPPKRQFGEPGRETRDQTQDDSEGEGQSPQQ